MLCDLHTHSIFSDGTCTPEEIVNLAIDAGLSAVALTDHNTVSGLPRFLEAASEKNLDIALGTEFSTTYDGRELHMLCLFIKPDDFSRVSELAKIDKARKEQSNLALIDSLGKAGIHLDYNEVKALNPNGEANRVHFATVMKQRGYVSSIDEAFQNLLSKKAGHYREPERLSVWEILDFIKSIGAVPVLAHPFLKLSERELTHFLPKAIDAGLVGMECYYSENDAATTEASLRIAKEFHLLPSGGSDFHGSSKPDIRIGVGKGNLQIPYEWYSALREKAR